MNIDTILASLREEISRHTGLAVLSQEKVVQHGHKNKVAAMQAAHNILENTWRYNMFYIKKGKRRHYISPDNVYSKCPKCGKDVPVDLGDWIEEDIWDISGVFCDDCAAKYNANGNDNG